MLLQIGFSYKDLESLELEQAWFYFEKYQDDKIQTRIDLFASQGSDLSDYKVTNSTYYSDWQKRKQKESERWTGTESETIEITKEEALQIKENFDREIDYVRGAMFLKKPKI